MTASLHILQILASPGWGGGEQYVLDLSRALLDRGHAVTFVCRSAQVAARLDELPAHRCHRLPLKNAADLPSALRLAALLRRERPDVIHVHHFKDAYLAALARGLSRHPARLVLTRHLVKPAKTHPLATWLYGELDHIAFVSELARTEFLSSHPRVASGRLSVVHNCVPEADEATGFETLRGDLPGVTAATAMLAFTGRLTANKGPHVLVEALGKIQGLDFFALFAGAGDPDEVRRLEARVHALGLQERVRFLGFVQNARALARVADIGVMPSVWREPFGLSALEFMRAGKAVVSTDNGAQVEFIESEETGLLVPPADPEALARALARLIEEPPLREKLGRQARAFVEARLSYSDFCSKWVSIYAPP